MARTPLRNVRVSDETWERWQAIAADRSQPVSGLIHEGVELLIASEGRPGPPPSRVRVHVPDRPAARSTPCEHRVAVGSYCSRGCDG